MDYRNYPHDWKSRIRPATLTRAEHCCEDCGVPNYALGYRDVIGGFHITEGIERGEMIGEYKVIKIILTISHQGHDISNNDPSNLKALCQRCHLTHDREYHRKMRRTNRWKREVARGQMAFEGLL